MYPPRLSSWRCCGCSSVYYMYMCVYICIHIYIHIYINIYIYIYIHMYIDTYEYIWIYMNIYVKISTYVWIHIYIYVQKHTCICLYTYIYTYIYIYIYTYIYKHIHILKYIYTYIHPTDPQTYPVSSSTITEPAALRLKCDRDLRFVTSAKIPSSARVCMQGREVRVGVFLEKWTSKFSLQGECGGF